MTILINLLDSPTFGSLPFCVPYCHYSFSAISPLYSFHAGNAVNFGTLTFAPFQRYTKDGLTTFRGSYITSFGEIPLTDLPYTLPMLTCPPQCTFPQPPTVIASLQFTFTEDTSFQLAWHYNYADYLAPSVPEPATWLLMIAGLLSVGASRLLAACRYTPVPQEGATL